MKAKIQEKCSCLALPKGLLFVACKVVCNGCGLSLSEGTATIEGGAAVASGRWADAPNLFVDYRDTGNMAIYAVLLAILGKTKPQNGLQGH
jgi:hypothetical protein